MTYQLTPVGSKGAAEVVPFEVPFEIPHNGIFGDVTSGGREVAPTPEPLLPVALADMPKLLARRAPVCPVHEVADCNVRR